MTKCNFYLTTGEGQVLIGYMLAENKKLIVRAQPGYQMTFTNILKEIPAKAKKEPEKVLRRMPRIFSGISLRAELVS